MTRRTKWTLAISTGVVVFCGLSIFFSIVFSLRVPSASAPPTATVLSPDQEQMKEQRKLLMEDQMTRSEKRLEVSPSPSEVAEEVLSKLKPGKITYDPPHEMKVAVPSPIEVRIGKLADSSPESERRLNAALTSGLANPALPPEPIRVSTTMKALLTGSKDEFQIDLKSPEEQIISSDEPTQWRWSVTPLKAGKRRLHLSAIAVVKVEGTEKVREYGVFDTDITVRVNLIHFLTEHWKEISSAVSGTGLIGWLLARFQKRKKQARHKQRGKTGACS